MGKGPHGGFLYATHYQIYWHIYGFFESFWRSKNLLQKVLGRRRPFSSLPNKLQFYAFAALSMMEMPAEVPIRDAPASMRALASS